MHTEFTTDNCEQLLKESPVLVVKFFANWCSPCRMLGSGAWPRLIEANSDVTIADCDTDKYSQLTQQYNVKALPTVVFFKNGVETGSRIEGANLQKTYQDAIDTLK